MSIECETILKHWQLLKIGFNSSFMKSKKKNNNIKKSRKTFFLFTNIVKKLTCRKSHANIYMAELIRQLNSPVSVYTISFYTYYYIYLYQI